MSHEILYTSAPQGLKPGSYGFCSVLATEGIPKALQDRLESLSGYEHAFALTDRRSHLNPINFSHLIVTVANQRYHLLSRVADAGADYSGRSNKIAHHVACLPNELTPCGPAGALLAPNFCKTSFDGEPHLLPTGVPLPSTGRGLAPCNAWRELTGDAGWAGALAEMTIKYPTRPITLIFKNGTDLLPLVAEAFSLLPIAERRIHDLDTTSFPFAHIFTESIALTNESPGSCPPGRPSGCCIVQQRQAVRNARASPRRQPRQDGDSRQAR